MADYLVGIDLGTTNSVVAYTPLAGTTPQISLLPIPQLVAPSTIEQRTQLPSFLYLATPAEVQAGQWDLPWATQRDFVVGEAARVRSAESPERTISAAKSWLCHPRVDRTAAILPWNAPSGTPQISPLLATQRYLEHLVAAWNIAHPTAPLHDQQVVLTVPASFDASARELTRTAALAAGLPEQLILLEEPQAAVYAWLAEVGDQWRKLLKLNETLLVIDIGGGTTDLTLVSVSQEQGELQLQRVAVGPHLLVGGDNMDLALAYQVAERFQQQGVNLDPWQSISLWHSCRAAKEQLLSQANLHEQTITVLSRGSRLLGGAKSLTLTRDEVAATLVEGFFPTCAVDAKPSKQRRSGFQELGLPFESDTAITRHIAAFLQSNPQNTQPAAILFNGGVFKSTTLRERLKATLADWNTTGTTPRELHSTADLDHAVARGAAMYAWAKQHGGVRIRGGAPRSYYVGIETAGLAIPGAPRPLRALCVVPRGMEEGTAVDVPSNEIGLVVGEPAQFRFFSSLTRQQDRPGELLNRWTDEELVETAPLETTLTLENAEEQDFVPVKFQAVLTELGLLELWCVSTLDGQRWRLAFSVRED
jgi:molecular chaperone DnaK (HSP70)